MDMQTTNLVFGTTVNLFSPEWTAGGSSGGSSVAVAARMTPFESLPSTSANGGPPSPQPVYSTRIPTVINRTKVLSIIDAIEYKKEKVRTGLNRQIPKLVFDTGNQPVVHPESGSSVRDNEVRCGLMRHQLKKLEASHVRGLE